MSDIKMQTLWVEFDQKCLSSYWDVWLLQILACQSTVSDFFFFRFILKLLRRATLNAYGVQKYKCFSASGLYKKKVDLVHKKIVLYQGYLEKIFLLENKIIIQETSANVSICFQFNLFVFLESSSMLKRSHLWSHTSLQVCIRK